MAKNKQAFLKEFSNIKIMPEALSYCFDEDPEIIDETENLDEMIFNREKGFIMRVALMTLSDMEREVIKLHFGIDEGEHTLQEIAEIYGKSKERIRQIEAKGFNKLRHPGRAGRMRPYL